MNQYEFIFLMEDEKDQKDLRELISSLSGKIIDEKAHGLKRLAYEIKKHKAANLFEWIIQLDLDKISEFKKKLGFREKVIRYLILKLEDKFEARSTKSLPADATHQALQAGETN